MRVLVTGGAGYIGSHTLIDLIENGHTVHSIDNFCNSDEYAFKAIKEITGESVLNSNIDLRDKISLDQFLGSEEQFDAIIHFAAFKAVEESVENPLSYYSNNIIGLINILEAAEKYDISKFIFSSSCTVYGNATELPVTELSPTQDAESPYGYTKQLAEQLIQDYCKYKNKIQFILLRYFNPAGAHSSGILGENPMNPPKNLVPIITEVAIGKREQLTVFGDDYPTRDGSNIRDYIHVMDLANAHSKSIEYLQNNPKIRQDVFNVGIGEGASVLEVIHAFETVTKQKLNYKIGPQRPGDVVAIYSNYQKAKKLLNWSPRHTIEDIMESSWIWEQNKSKIYKK